MNMASIYDDEDLLLLSGIQHYAFCARQWALIHIEQYWQENYLTAKGRLMHETVHETGRQYEKRGDTVIARGLPVRSRSLGLTGVCDVVEFIRDDLLGVDIFGIEGRFKPMPVEYKRGSPKADNCDVAQVVAQALCLEEMLTCSITDARLFYGATHHRCDVEINEMRRQEVATYAYEMHRLMAKKHVPKAKYEKKCVACSLYDYCQPKTLKKVNGVELYILEHMSED